MDDKWHHIAVAVDRDKYIALYQDGEFMGALSANTIGDITSGIELALGQDGTTKYSNFFNGSIADVRIWNVALEPAVVKEWYNQPITASHPKYNMLNAYWKLDEGLGTTLKDSNGTNNLVYGGTNIQWNSLISSVTPTYANAMKSVDIAVTALDHMGIHVENLDGKSLLPENQNPPKTNFNSDVTTVVKCDYVSFSSISQNYPLSYAWSFQGGTPSTSTIVNPIVKYPIPGVYPVSLTVSNIYGNDTKTVNSYITVSDTPPSNVIEFDGFEDYIRLPQTTANNYFNTIF
jgi:PKD repeat protein